MEGEIDTEQFMEEIRKYDYLFNRKLVKNSKTSSKRLMVCPKVAKFSVFPQQLQTRSFET